MGPNNYERGWRDAMAEADRAIVKVAAHNKKFARHRAGSWVATPTKGRL